MKYEITFSCGHEGVVNLYGRSDERERKLQWYENYAVCPECYKAECVAERAAAIERYNLPEITEGTEKQIKYANDLRARYAVKNSEEIERVIKWIALTKQPDFAEKCKANDMDTETAVSSARKQHKEAYAVLTGTSAKELIDILREG